MFIKEVEKLLGDMNSRFSTVTDLIDAWDFFVTQCEIGYEMGIYEYDNDLSVRNLIETILNKKSLSHYEEFYNFQSKIYSIDERLKKLFSNETVRINKSAWWEQGILKSGGDDYTNDVNSLL